MLAAWLKHIISVFSIQNSDNQYTSNNKHTMCAEVVWVKQRLTYIAKGNSAQWGYELLYRMIQGHTMPNRAILDHMGPHGTTWHHTEPQGPPYGIVRDYTVPFSTIRDHTGPHRIIQDDMGPYRVIWGQTGPYICKCGREQNKNLIKLSNILEKILSDVSEIHIFFQKLLNILSKYWITL